MNNALKPVAIVVSFTTSPTRLHKCRPVIDSLLNQTRQPDEIRLTLPSRFERTGEEYPSDEAMPDWLIGNSLVKIHRCDRDWGPATKIVPTVIQLQQRNLRSIVISVDDDIRYPSGAVSALAAAAIPCADGVTDHEVWCAAGFDIVNARLRSVKGHGQLCAVAEGFAGVAYPTRVFGSDFASDVRCAVADADLRFSDDIVISNYLACRGVKRRVLTCREYSQDILWKSGGVLAYGDCDDALHRGAGISVNNHERYSRVLTRLAADHRLCLPLKNG